MMSGPYPGIGRPRNEGRTSFPPLPWASAGSSNAWVLVKISRATVRLEKSTSMGVLLGKIEHFNHGRRIAVKANCLE